MTTTSSTYNSGGSSYLTTPGGFSLDHTTNGLLALHGTAQNPAASAPWTVEIDSITNPNASTNGYWMFFTTTDTYNATNHDCEGAVVDTGTVQFVNTQGSLLSLTVNGSLSFSVAGEVAGSTTCNGATSTNLGGESSSATTIAFGTVSSAANHIVCQIISAATNAANGYTIYIRDTGQATNQDPPGNTLTDFAYNHTTPTTFSGAGTEAYGYTTAGTGESQFSSNKWTGFNHGTGGNSSANNDAIATESTPNSAISFNTGFQVGVSGTTKPGTYQTTVVYTCTPVY